MCISEHNKYVMFALKGIHRTRMMVGTDVTRLRLYVYPFQCTTYHHGKFKLKNKKK